MSQVNCSDWLSSIFDLLPQTLGVELYNGQHKVVFLVPASLRTLPDAVMSVTGFKDAFPSSRGNVPHVREVTFLPPEFPSPEVCKSVATDKGYTIDGHDGRNSFHGYYAQQFVDGYLITT